PPERDLEWTEAGVEGAWRFVQRLWRLVVTRADGLPANTEPPAEVDAAALALRRATHKTIVGVTEDLEKFHFNRAVARIHELTNTLADVKLPETGAGEAGGLRWAVRDALEALVRLIGPMMPHLGEELWRA